VTDTTETPDLAECLAVSADDPLEALLIRRAVEWLSSGGHYGLKPPGVGEILEAAFLQAVSHFGDVSWYDPSLHWDEVELKVREILSEFVTGEGDDFDA